MNYANININVQFMKDVGEMSEFIFEVVLQDAMWLFFSDIKVDQTI